LFPRRWRPHIDHGGARPPSRCRADRAWPAVRGNHERARRRQCRSGPKPARGHRTCHRRHPATTIEGMRVKARAACWPPIGDPDPNGEIDTYFEEFRIEPVRSSRAGLCIGYATIRGRPPEVSNFAQTLAPNRFRLVAMRTPSVLDSELRPPDCGVVAPVFLPQPDFHLGRAGAGSPNQLRNGRSVRCTCRAKVSL
jgi:hypothetical protein